ncbi:MAG: hypothetical protein JRF52_00805 [Deltaproteobacteria bacterium]|nr:hypothetical protein [Deltaproteobacteria bacterium]
MKNLIHSPMVLKSGIASVDQAILSALNFVIAIFFIKSASKMEYGYYSIAITISLFLVSIQNAIVNTPMTVLLINKREDKKERYVNAIQATIAGAFCFAAIGILFREFMRSFFFAEEAPFKVLKMDALYASILLILITYIYMIHQIGVAIIFMLFGIISLVVSSLFGRGRIWHYDKKCVKESYRENWEFGKWALLGVLVTHMQNHSYLYLLGILVGADAVADVSAARLLLMPLLLFQVGWNKVAIPHGSKLREEGKARHFFKEQALVCIVFVLGVVGYVTCLLFFSDFLKGVLFTEKYSRSLSYIRLWGAVFALGFVMGNASSGLQVMKNFRIISIVNIPTMIVTVGCAYGLIQVYGIKGGLVALATGQALLAAGLWYHFTKAIFSS